MRKGYYLSEDSDVRTIPNTISQEEIEEKIYRERIKTGVKPNSSHN